MRFLEGSGDLAMIGTRGYLTISVGVTAASGCERRCSVAHRVRKSGLARIRHGSVRRSQPALCSIEPPGTGTMLHRAGGRVPARPAGPPGPAPAAPPASPAGPLRPEVTRVVLLSPRDSTA